MATKKKKREGISVETVNIGGKSMRAVIVELGGGESMEGRMTDLDDAHESLKEYENKYGELLRECKEALGDKELPLVKRNWKFADIVHKFREKHGAETKFVKGITVRLQKDLNMQERTLFLYTAIRREFPDIFKDPEPLKMGYYQELLRLPPEKRKDMILKIKNGTINSGHQLRGEVNKK